MFNLARCACAPASKQTMDLKTIAIVFGEWGGLSLRAQRLLGHVPRGKGLVRSLPLLRNVLHGGLRIVAMFTCQARKTKDTSNQEGTQAKPEGMNISKL